VRVSHLFATTLREAPGDADIASHQLLLRAGYVRQLAAGIFSYLPLAQRSLLKIARILREELDGIGGQEISLPVVHPAEIWQATGRWYEIDDTMARVFPNRQEHDSTNLEAARAVAAREDVLPIGLFYRNEAADRYDAFTAEGIATTRDAKLAALETQLDRYQI